MAQVTYRVDDLDGKSKVTRESTVVSFGNETVTIDLSDKHVDELRALLAPYFENGVVTTNPVKNARKTANASDNADRNVEIRAWASENGHEVNARGRLPKNVVDAYNDAHSAIDLINAAVTVDENAA